MEPNCTFWNAWESWDQGTKDGLLNYALASMDALANPFFWNWKVRKPPVTMHTFTVSDRHFRSGTP